MSNHCNKVLCCCQAEWISPKYSVFCQYPDLPFVVRNPSRVTPCLFAQMLPACPPPSRLCSCLPGPSLLSMAPRSALRSPGLRVPRYSWCALCFGSHRLFLPYQSRALQVPSSALLALIPHILKNHVEDWGIIFICSVALFPQHLFSTHREVLLLFARVFIILLESLEFLEQLGWTGWFPGSLSQAFSALSPGSPVSTSFSEVVPFQALSQLPRTPPGPSDAPSSTESRLRRGGRLPKGAKLCPVGHPHTLFSAGSRVAWGGPFRLMGLCVPLSSIEDVLFVLLCVALEVSRHHLLLESCL